MDLEGILNSSILVRKLPWSRGLPLPGIIVSPRADGEVGGTGTSVDMKYTIAVAVARVSNQDLTGGLGTILLWREAISRSFREKGIVAAMGTPPAAGPWVPPYIPELYDVRVRHGAVLWEPGFLNQHDVGVVLVDCFCRLARLA